MFIKFSLFQEFYACRCYNQDIQDDHLCLCLNRLWCDWNFFFFFHWGSQPHVTFLFLSRPWCMSSNMTLYHSLWTNHSNVNLCEINQNYDIVHESKPQSYNLKKVRLEAVWVPFREPREEWKERALNGIKVKGGKNMKQSDLSRGWVSPD